MERERNEVLKRSVPTASIKTQTKDLLTLRNTVEIRKICKKKEKNAVRVLF
jgi:hypothetical protein